MSDDRTVAAALIAAYTGLLQASGATWQAYDVDDVPEALPRIYVAVTVTRRVGSDFRMCGGRGATGWRVTTLGVGTTIDEARWALEQVAKLEDTRPVVTGLQSTHLRLEASTPPDSDDGLYSGLSSWTFATSPN